VQVEQLLCGLHAPRLVAGEARACQRADDDRPKPRVVLENQGPHARILSGAGQLAGYQTRPNVFTRNTAICARVFGLSGQYLRGEVLHPPVIPSP